MTTFVLLTPGVTNDGNFGLLTFRGVANGNNFLLDGNDSTEQFYLENNGRTRVLSPIAQDSDPGIPGGFREFLGQYGRAMGGVVNTVTRAEPTTCMAVCTTFYRNQDLTRTIPSPTSIPIEWRLQSGASVGGAIIKNKLFYFFERRVHAAEHADCGQLHQVGHHRSGQPGVDWLRRSGHRRPVHRHQRIAAALLRRGSTHSVSGPGLRPPGLPSERQEHV